MAIGVGFLAFAATTYYLGVALTQNQPTATPEPPVTRTAEPSADPTTSPAPSPTPTDPPESEDPPELPWPRDAAEAEEWMRENALYDHQVQRTDCAIERLGDPDPPEDLTTFDAHLNRSAGCLTQVWAGPADEAGFVVLQPPVRAYDQQITTACGDSPAMDYAAAFYCSGDQRIYYAVPRSYPLFGESSLEVDVVLAHEFGHAVQGRIGIIGAKYTLGKQAETKREVLEISRRVEMQADCLAGVAVNALAKASGITEAEREIIRQDRYYRGDDEGTPGDHGAPESRRRWVSAGLETRRIGTCDTFSVDASEVS